MRKNIFPAFILALNILWLCSVGGIPNLAEDVFAPKPEHASGVYDRSPIKVNISQPTEAPKSVVPIRRRPSISSGVINNTGKAPKDWECYNEYRYCLDPNATNTNYSEPEPRLRKPCACSSDCFTIGDCCPDAQPAEDNQDQPRDDKVLYTCQYIDTNIGSNSYFIVSRCPSDWDIEDIRDQCESIETRAFRDQFLDLLVTSVENNVTYKNIYCAACNSQKKLVPWELLFYCQENLTKASLMVGTNSSDEIQIDDIVTTGVNDEEATLAPLFDDTIPYKESLVKGSSEARQFNNTEYVKKVTKCPFKMKFPEGVRENLIPCSDQFISTCISALNKGKNKDLNEKLCATYVAPVTTLDEFFGKAYKNKFCAFCNGQRYRQLKCLAPKSIHTYTMMTKVPDEAFGGSFERRRNSLALLVDIDFMSGGTVVGTSLKCPPGSVYDPWTEVCRNVFCGDNAVYDDGICRRDNSQGPIDQVSNESSIYTSCLKMVTQETFTLYDNGTLEFKNRGLVLPLGEYQIKDDNTSVQICALTDPYIDRFGEDQNILSFVCIVISLVSLFLKVFLHLVDPSAGKVAQKSIASLSISLFIAQLLFLIGIPHPDWGIGCTITGVLIHYFFMASFFWSNTLAYDIWRTFTSMGLPSSATNKYEVNKRFILCSLYAWGFPAAIVIISVLFDTLPWKMNGWRPHYGEGLCWISNRPALLAFFAAPLAALLMINIVFFLSTAYKIACASKDSKFAHQNTGKKDYLRFGLYIKLALIMGLTWAFGFIAPFSGNDVLWYVFIVLNGLQGTFILLAFTQFKKLWKLLVVDRKSASKPKNLKNSRLSDSSRSNLATSVTNVTNTNL